MECLWYFRNREHGGGTARTLLVKFCRIRGLEEAWQDTSSARIRNITELPFCPEYREYLGLFIDLIIEISGQKGDFFWNFQFFLY